MVRGMCSVGFLHPKGMRGGGGRAWKMPFLHLGMEGWDREGFEGVTGTGVSMDKKECPGTVEILMEKGFHGHGEKQELGSCSMREVHGKHWGAPVNLCQELRKEQPGIPGDFREFQCCRHHLSLAAPGAIPG